MTVYDGYYFGGPRTLEEMTMSTDTRPSVTVVGTLVERYPGEWCVTLDGLNDLPEGMDLRLGAEVDVTIRRHERFPANPWPAPREQGAE